MGAPDARMLLDTLGLEHRPEREVVNGRRTFRPYNACDPSHWRMPDDSLVATFDYRLCSAFAREVLWAWQARAHGRQEEEE